MRLTHHLTFHIFFLVLDPGTGHFGGTERPALAQDSITAKLTFPTSGSLLLSTGQKPAHVIVDMEANEYVGTLADGVQYQFWGFNRSVPGPMIRVRVGDTVTIHFRQCQNK